MASSSQGQEGGSRDPRRELNKTDETTLSQGLARNIAVEQRIEHENALNIQHEVKKSMVKAIAELRITSPQSPDTPIFHASSLHGLAPLEILKRSLGGSLRSNISTHSAFAENNQKARQNKEKACLKVIGNGECGTIYEIPGTEMVIKRSLKDPELLSQDFTAGEAVYKARYIHARHLMDHFGGCEVPQIPKYLWIHTIDMQANAAKDWWWEQEEETFSKLDKQYQQPGHVMSIQRILPIFKLNREALIKYYFPEEEQAKALKDSTNDACLLRPYLRWESTEEDPVKLANRRKDLRNFPLYRDDLQAFDMDCLQIAKDMALGLAVMHWGAGIAPVDVEFVIGTRPRKDPATRLIGNLILADQNENLSSSKKTEKQKKKIAKQKETPTISKITEAFNAYGLDFTHRDYKLWIMDWNQTTTFRIPYKKKDRANAIKELVGNTRTNDGYYPSAFPVDQEGCKLWKMFANTYIEASERVMQEVQKGARDSWASDSWDKYLAQPTDVIKAWEKMEAKEVSLEKPKVYHDAVAKSKKEEWNKLFGIKRTPGNGGGEF